MPQKKQLLTAVIWRRLGVEEDAGDLRMLQSERAFEICDDLVNAGHGKVVWQCAVAVHLNGEAGAGVAAREGNLVDIENFGKGTSSVAELCFKVGRRAELGVGGDGFRFAFDVGEQGGDAGDLAADGAFQLRDDGVGVAKTHGFGHFEMLLDGEAAAAILHADIVHGKISLGGNGTDAFEDAFGERGGGHGANDDVSARQAALDRGGGLGGDLFDALEGEIAGQAQGEIDEVKRAGAAEAEALGFEDVGDGFEFADEVVAEAIAELGWGGVEEGIQGLAGELEGDIEDDSGNKKSG